MFRLVVSVLVGLGLLLGGAAATAGGKKDDKKKDRPVQGIVQKVDKEEGKEGVVLVVDVTAGKKDAAAGEKTQKRFQVTSSAKIEKVSGKKDNATRTEMKLDDLKAGQHVIVAASNGKVEKVEIVIDKKKSK